MVDIVQEITITGLKKIESYYENKWKENKEAELKQDTLLKEAFLKAIEFYDRNYPKTNYGNVWDSKKESLTLNKEITFKANVEHYNEQQLLVARTVLTYALQEKLHNQDMAIRDLHNACRGEIMKLIPASRYLDEEDTLKKEAQKIENRKKEIEAIRARERKELEDRIKKPIIVPPLQQQPKVEIPKVEQPKEVPKIEIPKEVQPEVKNQGYVCPICNKSCSSGAGLASHTNRVHNKVI